MNNDNLAAAVALAVPFVFHPKRGFSRVAWLDARPRAPVWRIGYGTSVVDGEPVRAGMLCTRAQADLWAAAELAGIARQILPLVRVTLDEARFTALISLVYDIGIDRFAESTVLAALNRGHYSRAAELIGDYDRAGGTRVWDLVMQRAKERVLFATGLWPDLPPDAA